MQMLLLLLMMNLIKDSFMSEIYKASAPNGIIVEILSIDDFMKNTGTHKYSNKRLLILLKNIETVYELYLRQFKGTYSTWRITKRCRKKSNIQSYFS